MKLTEEQKTICNVFKQLRYGKVHCAECPMVLNSRHCVCLKDVQPVRHGRWIEVDDAYNRISGRCSNCGWKAHLYEDDVVGMPYCPNCGARMDEGDNNAKTM